MNAFGYILQFFHFLIGLFSKDSDEHLEDAYEEVSQQDETISELEEDIAYQEFKNEIEKAQTEQEAEDALKRIEEYYRNRGNQ